jgi:hypothetical protein
LKTKTKFWQVLIFIMVLTVPFTVMTYHQLTVGDYPDHLEFAVELAENGFVIALPHTLFAKSVVILRTLLPFTLVIRLGENVREIVRSHSYEITALLLITVAYALTIFVIWKRALLEFRTKGINHANRWSMLVTVILMIVGPIFIFTFPESQYLGYFTANPFHNPTFILLKPMALIWFYVAAENLFGKSSIKQVLITALLVFLATSTKPSFTITILPAIGLLWLFFYTKKFKQLNWLLLIGGMGIMAVVVLATQYLVSYTAAGLDESVEKFVITPFKTLLSYSDSYFNVILKIVMSTIFPLYITIYYWKDVKHKTTFQLGWLNYLVGVIMAVLFSEEIRYQHGNFLWGPMIGIFILFFITIVQYVNDLAPRLENKHLSWSDWIPAILLNMHVICGIVFYITDINAPGIVG